MSEGRLTIKFSVDEIDREEINIAVSCAVREMGDTVDIREVTLTLPPEVE